MVRLGTFCNSCKFYIDNKCSHGLLDHFKSAGADVQFNEEDGHSVDRVCLYRRQHDWNTYLSLEESIKLVNQEVFISGSIVLVVKSIDGLKNALERLKDDQYKKFSLIFGYTNQVKYKDINSLIKEVGIENNYIFVKVFDESKIGHIIDESARKAKNGFIFTIDASQPFDTNMITKINHFVNKKMNRLFYVYGTNGYHQSVCFSVIYKLLKGHKLSDIDEKIKALMSSFEDNHIRTWKEINDEYRH